ncbi:MAG: glutathione S-transferase family protein [Alphaproteobacteria bacterium]|nr:glutathione S-transferase family protein [Alphaproteobacteria bacterium]
MYKLYYSPGACSMGIHIALNECGQEVELEEISFAARQNRSAEYLAINPRGHVPTLVEDGRVLREGAAILIHVLEKHDSPLLPKSGPERDAAIEWLMFANSTLHPAYARVFFLKRGGVTEGTLMDAAATNINDLWSEVEHRLAEHPYICGDKVTIADILLTVIANWSGNVPKPIHLGPNTKRLLKEISSRPAYQKALADERVEYKAAA